MADALRVVAHLASPLANEPPHLDGLLVYVASRRQGKGTVPGYKVDRKYPCPDTSLVRIPLLRRSVAGQSVAACTSPILPVPSSEYVEHVAKRIGVEHSGLLASDERRVVTTTNQWTKSYRLPLRLRVVSCVVWLCVGTRKELLNLLVEVPALGKKGPSNGYGRVKRWEIERIGPVPHDRWPWWIDSPAGPVLMRPLPVGEYLPANLIGARRDYCAVSDPYWHSDRYCEAVAPC